MTEIEELKKHTERAARAFLVRHRAGLVPLDRQYIRQVYDGAHPRAFTMDLRLTNERLTMDYIAPWGHLKE